jgi:XRE family transcriptional regulator, regulator of sulfur utilization
VADSLSHNLALNIRRLRDEAGLSQRRAANTAQIPRPTWANLESGDANPTLSVLTRVASSLNVPVERLLSPPPAGALRYAGESLPNRRRGKVLIRSLLPRPPVGLDIERYVLAGAATLAADPHPAGYREYLTPETGEIELVVAGETYRLLAGDVLVFRADQPHHYRNPGRAQAIAYSILSLAGTELG